MAMVALNLRRADDDIRLIGGRSVRRETGCCRKISRTIVGTNGVRAIGEGVRVVLHGEPGFVTHGADVDMVVATLTQRGAAAAILDRRSAISRAHLHAGYDRFGIDLMASKSLSVGLHVLQRLHAWIIGEAHIDVFRIDIDLLLWAHRPVFGAGAAAYVRIPEIAGIDLHQAGAA